MFTVSRVIYIFWMFGHIHVNTVGDTGTAHMDPVDMKLLMLWLGHPGLARDLGPLNPQQVGGRGEVGGGGNGDGSGGLDLSTRPLPELGAQVAAVVQKTIFGLFIAKSRHARVLRAER